MGNATRSTRPPDLALPLVAEQDLDPLLDRIGDARYVLLGEASHGTHEYYRWRAAITRRLVRERGFSFVAVEGDWPDCFAINRWVRGLEGAEHDGATALRRFDRWPTWMWANSDVADFIDWLRTHNDAHAESERVGFYGIDVYSLWESMRAVLGYLEEHEPDAAPAAREAFRCFEPYREDPQAYAQATRVVPTSCEEEVVRLLTRICEEGAAAAGGDPEERFAAEQNAAVARSAEQYYRAMVTGGPESWNVRDTHMVDTLDRLMGHHGPAAKCIVWAHNTHIGDARATDMASAGMTNLGQLVRERYSSDGVVAVGFAGYRGTVIAADAWDDPAESMEVPAARDDSMEALLHNQLGRDALLVFPPQAHGGWLTSPMPHRAIGVVYRPQRERWGNYVPTILSQRYDALLSFEDTSALRPLTQSASGAAELTFPYGL